MNSIMIHKNIALARLTRDSKYLPERYKELLKIVAENKLKTTRDIAEADPFHKKTKYKTFKSLMDFYGSYLRKLHKLGFVDRAFTTVEDQTGTTITRCYEYSAIELKPKRIQLKRYESLNIR